MTKRDYSRPVLRAIDELKRQRVDRAFLDGRPPSMPTAIPLAAPKRIDFEALNTSARELEQDVHLLACSLLADMEKHKDVRLVNKLIAAAAAASIDTIRLRLWFHLFGPIEFIKGKTKYKHGKPSMIEIAMATPFWTLKLDD